MSLDLEEKPNIRFQQIELLNDQPLGIGSYGSVCKAMCDDLLCAAKLIHPTLVQQNTQQQILRHREHRLPIRRFEKEIEFLSDMRHPNIIQYLGVWRDPDTGYPVLLMELMDESLTHYLGASVEPVPYHIQVIISVDISTALSFLHLNGIVHRDLSSNNVLLIGKGIRAKLTDFGMAKLVDGGMSHVSNTLCPGTDAYMPPEAIDNQAMFPIEGDIFSLGVNIIQILTKKFPAPGNRFQTIDYPPSPTGRIEIRVPEVERRNNHISEIDQAHPLLPIAIDCLKDRDARPSARELCRRLTALKRTPEYTDSERMEHVAVPTHQSVGHSQSGQQTATTVKDHEITVLRQQLMTQQDEHDKKLQLSQQMITAKEQEKQDLQKKMNQIGKSQEDEHKKHEEVIARYQKQIDKLELNSRITSPFYVDKPKSPMSPSSPVQLSPTAGEMPRLIWHRGRKAPCKMDRNTDAVVDGSFAYFRRGRETKEVYSFNFATDTWSRLPDCRTEYTTLAVVNGVLTTIGGISSNQLFSLTGEGRASRWTEEFPPMPTKRYETIAVCTGKNLIVTGGENLKTVEVLNIDKRVWSTAADIPQPLSAATAIVCGNWIYLSAGNVVIACSLPTLLQSCHSKSVQTVKSSENSIWTIIANLPVNDSTLVSFNNRIIAVGGCDSSGRPLADVHMYNPISDTWQIISRISTPRMRCFAVSLPRNKLMIVGGFTSQKWNSSTDTVEIGSFK